MPSSGAGLRAGDAGLARVSPDVNFLKPANELARVTALHDCGVVDTPPEEPFDELTRLLAKLCNVPIAVISFIDSNRQWNKSQLGLDAREIARGDSICAHTILHEGGLLVEDCAGDARFQAIPIVRGEPRIRSYAGAPIVTADGLALGTVAVMDPQPGKFSRETLESLQIIARQASLHLALRRNLHELKEKHTRTEFALRQSESFYHSLVESLPQNIIRKDAAGRFTFANSRFCATINRTLQEVIGKTDADLFPAELAAKYRADDLQVLEDQKTIDTVEKHQTADDLLYVRVIKTPLFDTSGKVIGIQGLFWDETERYKAQEALAHERNLLRALLENIPDRVYFKDTKSRFVSMSSAFARSVGLKSPEDAFGKTDADIFSAEHALNALRDEQEILRTVEPIIGKVEKETWPDGRETWCLTTKMAWRDSEGGIRGTFGISRDITDLKIAEKQIADARDAALETARLKSEFLANMSHEIRTPMNAIVGMTGLLLDTGMTADQRDFAETIRLSADSLLNIINDILDFSKIEAGKMHVEVIDFDLTDLVEGAADLLAERAQKKGIELAAWIHEQVPGNVKGDPGRLRQILANLLGNAVKFTERGEVVLDVTRVGSSGDRDILRFAVRDTGIGIPEEAQPRIFEAFTQADGSMTRRYGGTGLGLAITRQLIQLMGGKLGFESHPGQGTTFWFEMPLEVNTGAPPDKAAVDGTLQGARVLIVDDNATNRQILQYQTGAWGMRNETAASAAEALAAMRSAVAANDPFKVALLDMQMPGADGLALAKQIKADGKLGYTQLVMLTSLGYLPDEQQWREVGIRAYLVKPVKQFRLAEALGQVLRAPIAKPAPKAAEKLAPATAATKTALRILLAEDNPVNQKVALRQLARLGHQVEAVANGLEAVKAMERFVYSIVLMDCQMPELDGYKATARIRQMEVTSPFRWARSPYIIAMTANALAGDREACLAAGMDDYLSKPVRIEDLDAALQRGVEAKGTVAPAAAAPAVPEASHEGVLDAEAIENLRMLRVEGEPDPLAELVELFLKDTPARIAQMQAALDRSDSAGLEAAAHSLKGSASNLGARNLAADCARLMNLGRKNDLGPALKHVRSVVAEFPRVKAALAEELRR